MKPLLADETLFREIEVFDPDYVPEQFNYRNNQLSALSGCVKPALRGSRPMNAVLVGPPATGKTTSIKLAFQQLEEFSKRIVPVYVNCALLQSPFRIFSEIHKKVLGFLPPETGSPLTKIYDSVFERLAKEKKSLLVALDDISLSNSEILYSILRAHEMYSVKTGVFSAVPRNELYKLDEKTRSIFCPQEIVFPVYTQKEIAAILDDRASCGLYPDVISPSLIGKIAEAASERNDLRFGIELLKRAALEAENTASRVIKDVHLRKALGSGAEKDTKSDGGILLEMIKDNPGINSGSLFKLLKDRANVSYSTFYRLLKRLETEGKIITKETGKAGRTRIISVA